MRGRHLGAREAVRFQGVVPAGLRWPSSEACIYALLGNAMSANVLSRLLSCILPAIHPQWALVDPWTSVPKVAIHRLLVDLAGFARLLMYSTRRAAFCKVLGGSGGICNVLGGMCFFFLFLFFFFFSSASSASSSYLYLSSSLSVRVQRALLFLVLCGGDAVVFLAPL